jgi:hypothetical protein
MEEETLRWRREAIVRCKDRQSVTTFRYMDGAAELHRLMVQQLMVPLLKSISLPSR